MEVLFIYWALFTILLMVALRLEVKKNESQEKIIRTLRAENLKLKKKKKTLISMLMAVTIFCSTKYVNEFLKGWIDKED